MTLPPLRGREAELARAAALLDGAVRTGRGGVLVVQGRPGIGKTRLLREVVALAGRRDVRAGYGAAEASDRVVPIGPFHPALFGGDPPVADPDLRERLHYLPEQRYRLLDELEAVLEAAALAGPVLLALDDVQWADGASLTALRTLPARMLELPLLWVVALRPGAGTAEAAVSALERLAAGGTATALGPLGPAAVAQVATDLLGAPPDDALLDLATRAHGSPFLLVELVRGLQEEGLVTVSGGRAVLRETRLPARLRDGMRDRLARLTPPAREVAGTAAALGRSFTFGELAAVLGRRPSSLLAPVEELYAAGLLVDDGGTLAFRHDLLRDAVRDTLPPSALRALQRQAVDALLAAGAPPVEIAAQLAATADPGDAAAVGTLAQAARALAGSDPATAADLARRALDLAAPGDGQRTELVGLVTVLLHAAGRTAEGKAFTDGVLRGALTAEQEAEVLLAVAGLIGVEPDLRAEASERALGLPGLPPELRARHRANLVHSRVVAGRAELAARALAEARAAGDGGGAAAFALDLADGALSYAAGDYRRALAQVEAAARDGAAAGDPARARLAQQWRSEVLAVLDRYGEAFEIAVENVARAERDRQSWAVRLWEGGRGRHLLQAGRLVDAAAALEGSLDGVLDGELGLVGTQDAAALVGLGRAALHLGDSALLARCLDAARAVPAGAAPGVRRHAAWLLACARLAAGDPAGAADLVRSPDVAPVLPLFPVDVADEVTLVRIALAAGDPELAAAAVAGAADRAATTPGAPSIAGTAAHARGLAAGDEADLAAAVAAFARGPRPVALASAYEDAGRLALAGGDRERGLELLDRALQAYAAAGAAWDAGRVRGRLRGAGVRRRLAAVPPPRHGWDGLTDSELEVVRLVARGLTNRETAERLFLSAHTVSSHLRHAFAKLGINSRVELARVAAGRDDD